MDPAVSVIIPCGPRHVEHVRMAAASVARLTVPAETIVIADGGAHVPPLPGVRHLDTGGERRGPAAARNIGIAAARAPFIVPLDADDYLTPRGVEHLLRRFAVGDVAYTYGDAYTVERDGTAMLRAAPDYDQAHMARYNQHAVTALYPTRLAQAVGGYDERVDIWEDWTLPLRLAQAGACGRRIPFPVFVYRVYEGDRMTRAFQTDLGAQAQQAVRTLYQDREGRIIMRRCCGGDPALAPIAQATIADLPEPNPMIVGDGLLRVEYLGDSTSAITYDFGRGQRLIRLGNNAADRYADLSAAEIAWLLARGVPVRVLPQPDPPTPPTPLEPALDAVAPGTPEPTAVAPTKRGKP